LRSGRQTTGLFDTLFLLNRIILFKGFSVDDATLEAIRADIKAHGVCALSDFTKPGVCELVSIGFSKDNIPEIRMSIKTNPSFAAALFNTIVGRWEEGHIYSDKLYSLEGLVPADCGIELYRVVHVSPINMKLATAHHHLYPNNFRIYDIQFIDAAGKTINPAPSAIPAYLH
jgi:hypothetical protein